MRIVWICHFSNKEIQKILKPRKLVNEFAPWITGLIKLFEAEPNVDLHIVAPYEYISGNKEFKLRGINYHFFNAHIPIWGRHWPGFFKFDYWTHFFSNKRIVKKIVNRIKPDLIHLHGAENAYYSATILQFINRYPILVTIQGFISNSITKNQQVEKKIKIEEEILTTLKYFGCQTKTIADQVTQINPNAILHQHKYYFTKPEFKEVEKIYDLVFFARISKDKGIEDLITTCSGIKKYIKELSIIVIGEAQKNYLDFLKHKVEELGLTDNITWTGFLQQQEAHSLLLKAKICVLPTYNEIISGTIIESMFLKLPVVAYNVGSIHEVNEKEDIIRLVPKGDIKKLAEEIKILLTNDKLLMETAEKGYKRVNEMFNNNLIVPDILKAYNGILSEESKKLGK